MTRFTELLQIPDIAARYQKVRKYFHLRESAYDVTSKCQLRCDGCYYFEGDKYKTNDISSAETWKTFFRSERQRGINYAVLAGAEPSLVPQVLRAAAETIEMGTIASNGLRPIDRALRYRVHVSVWGDPEGDRIYRPFAGGRPGPDFLRTQLANYENDDRVVFVYTFNGRNTDQADEVAELLATAGHPLTFNVFSAPENYPSDRLRTELTHIGAKMTALLQKYPGTIRWSEYNTFVHTNPRSLDEQFGCVYPRARERRGDRPSGIGLTFRSYRTDLTHATHTDCCVPDTDCRQCRHYAAGSAIVSSRMDRHVDSEDKFRGWLDYVDTYLSVWVLGYVKSPNLQRATA